MPVVYRRNLPHIENIEKTYFVTFHCKDDFELSPSARDIALKHMVYEHKRRIELHVAVVMPNHAHMLFDILEDERAEPFPLASITQSVKSVSAHNINKRLNRRGPVWQDESFDHSLRSEGDFSEKMIYIIGNPVKAGLVKNPNDYKWLWRSS